MPDQDEANRAIEHLKALFRLLADNPHSTATDLLDMLKREDAERNSSFRHSR